MAMNWARGLDELGTGLLRQADIGNKAYEGAMSKEAEQRAANRALRAEERKNTEWARRHGIESGEARTVAKDLLAGREGMQADLITAEQGRLDTEIQARKDAAEKKWENDKEAAKLLATSKGEADKIDRLMDRAKTEAKTFETLATAYAESDDEEHRLRLEKELLLSVDRMEAAYKQAGLPKLSIDENLSELKYGLIVPQVIFNVNSNVPKDKLRTVYKAFRDNDPESDVYKNALETLDRYVQEAIDKGMVPEYRSKVRTKTELTKRVVDYMSKNYAKELEGGENTDLGDGNVGGTIGFRQEASVAIERLTEMSEEDLINSLETGALAAAEELPSPDRPGRTGNPKLKAIESAKKRDPAHLLDILKEARTKPAYGSRTDKIDKLIGILERFLTNSQASVLPDPDPVRGYPSLAMAQPAGMLGQEPGMIFEADRMPMDKASVNARYA